ncbi:recombinase family protein [Citricoccus sp.]|uniref:recombinase family protein n=1 Tax=Citricoccus sp. TaxID=1978372 RepID=UPI0028BEE1AA|nr:recombinase family protein [Citricoccus sp.]
MKRAILYLRLSSATEESTSLVRQEADLRAHADREGWAVTDVLVDDGISGRKARAKATEAVRRLADGEADVLAAWKLDRFTRQGWDGLGELSEALATRKAAGDPALFYTLHDNMRSDDSTFRLIAGVLSEVARTEAENTVARVVSHIAYQRNVARRWSGGPIPFGYQSAPAQDGKGRVLVPDPIEAPIVAEVAAWLVARVTLSDCARRLRDRGVPTAGSPARRARQRGEPVDGLEHGTWKPSTIRRAWTAEHLLGRYKYHGRYVLGDDGLPLEVWPPLVDRATLHAVRAAVDWHAPGTRSPDSPRRKRAARLLSGVAYCAQCGAKMYVTTNGGRVIYACRAGMQGNDCTGQKMLAERLEAVVAEQFLSVVGDTPELVEADPTADVAAAAGELADVQAALTESTAALMDDDADTEALLARIAGLKGRRAALRSTPGTRAGESKATGRTLREAWSAEDVPVAARRDLLLTAIDHVIVSKSDSRRAADAHRRVQIAWNS